MITLYSKPGCVQCNATVRSLDNAKLQYSTIDVSKDEQALELIKAMGYMQVPVVVTDNDHWSGFRPDKIDALKELVSA